MVQMQLKNFLSALNEAELQATLLSLARLYPSLVTAVELEVRKATPTMLSANATAFVPPGAKTPSDVSPYASPPTSNDTF